MFRIMNDCVLSKRRLLFLGLVIVYIASFNLVYINQLTGLYASAGYTFHAQNLTWNIIIFVIAVLPAFWMPINLKRPSVLAIWMIYVCVYLPSCYLSLYTTSLPKEQLLIDWLALLFSFLILHVTCFLKPLRIRFFSINTSYVWIIIMGLVFLMSIMIFIRFSHIMHFVGFHSVYVQRALYVKNLSSRDMGGYFIGWLGGVFFPFFVLYGLCFKRYLLLPLGLFGLFFLYTITAEKSIFAAILLLPFALMFFKYVSKNKACILIFFLLINGVLISSVAYLLFHNIVLLAFFFRRMLVDGGLMTSWYWTVFYFHPFVYLSYTIFHPIFVYPYRHALPVAVSLFMTGKNSSPNANFLASAYANFGAWGMLVYALIVSIFFWIYDSVARYWPKEMGFAVIVWITYNFMATDLLVAMLTDGCFIWFLLLYLLRPEKQKTNKN